MSSATMLVRLLLTCGIFYVSSVESRSVRSGAEESADRLVPVAVIYESLSPTTKHNGIDHGHHQEAAKPAEAEPPRPVDGEVSMKPTEAEAKPTAEKDNISPAMEAQAKPMAEQDSIPMAMEIEKKPILEQEADAKPIAAKDDVTAQQSDTKVEEQSKKEEPELMAAMQAMAAEERPVENEEEEKPAPENQSGDNKTSENSANDQENFLRWSESHIAQVPSSKQPETRQRPPAQPLLQGFQSLQQALKKPEEPAAAATNSEPQKQNRPIVSAVQQAITNTANRPNRPIAAALVNAIPKPTTQSKASGEPVKQANGGGGLLASIGEAFNNFIGNNANKEQANQNQQAAAPEQPTSNRPIDKFQNFFNAQINQLTQNFSQAIESLRPKPNENDTSRPNEQQLNQMQEDFNKQVAVLKNRVSSAFENYTMEQQNPNKNETLINLQFIRGMGEIWEWMVSTFQGVANGQGQSGEGQNGGEGGSGQANEQVVVNQNDEEGGSSAEAPGGGQGGAGGGDNDPFKPMKDKFTEFYNNIQTSMSQYFGQQTQNDPVDGSTSQGQWPNPFNDWFQQIMQYFNNNNNNSNNNNAAAPQPEGAQNEGETTQQNNNQGVFEKPNFVNQIGNFFNNLQGGGGASSGASSEKPNFISQAGDGINNVINNFQKPQGQASAEQQPQPAQNSPVETPETSSST